MSPLTTEKVWTIDPSDLNPSQSLDSQARCRAERYSCDQASWRDWRLLRSGGERTSRRPRLYPLGKLTYFHPIGEFPCTSFEPNEPESWFATFQGAEHGAIVGSKFWEDLLSENKVKLRRRLLHVRGEFPELAEKAARDIFVRWLADVDHEWREQSIEKTSQAEWDLYQESPKDAGICAVKKLFLSKNGKAKFRSHEDTDLEEHDGAFAGQKPKRGIFGARTRASLGGIIFRPRLLNIAETHSWVSS